MNLIPTTATAAEKLKRLAKNQRKVTGSSLAAALDSVAQASGYANWKHVTACVDQTPASTRVAPLPEELADLLADAVKRHPPTAESERALRAGLVFAMDVKDAEDMTRGADVVECDDIWPLAAADMWRILVHEKIDETDLSLVECLDTENLIQTAQDDLGNYRFFRYIGATTPSSLDEAFSQVLGRYFFPPVYVWLAGKFIDVASVPEVRIDGKVVYRSSPGGSSRTAPASSSPAHVPQDLATSVVVKRPSRGGLIFRLDVSRVEPGLYEARLSCQGQEIDEPTVHSSIRSALEDAADITGDVKGLEVAYGGLVVGTYTLESVRSESEQIARRAVAVQAALGEF